MIFVPLGRAEAEQLRTDGASGPVRGFAATPSMLRAHGLDPKDADEAAFTAQSYAMTAGLLAGVWPDGSRLVLAHEAPDHTVIDDHGELGEVQAASLSWAAVESVFSDGPAPDEATRAAVTRTAAELAGSDLGDAVETPALEALLQDHDLLWHVRDESW